MTAKPKYRPGEELVWNKQMGMTSHYDYGPDKTKAEKRERKKEKRREDMDAGKKAKLLHALAMKRAGVPDDGGRKA